MNIALAGLTAREEVALGMLVGKTLPGWQCMPAADGPRAPLPLADLYVVDLAGRGMSRWTEASQVALLSSLGGAPAVLVAPAFDQTWSALETHRIQGEPLVLLHKPYGVEAMRAALQQAASGLALPAPPRALPAMKPAPPDRARLPKAHAVSGPPFSVAPIQTLPPAMALPVPAAMPTEVAPALVEHKLGCSEFQARMGPLSGKPLFLRKLAESLAQQHPFELRVSFIHRMIFHPREQWVASNAPMPVLEKLCQDDQLALSVEIDPIDDQDAPARALRLDIPPQPLEVLLWTLAHDLDGPRS